MTLRERLLTNQNFEFRKNLFYQKGLPINQEFEKAYLKIREEEGRLYKDDQVNDLPHYKGNPQLESEWKIRKQSAERLIQHLQSQGNNKLILELGCGNGWLTNMMATSIPSQVIGLDLNKTELIQASRVFEENRNVAFIYGDIFSIDITADLFDIVVLASAVQYFPDVQKLIHRLFQVIKPGGEIHIIDSPFYDSVTEQERARKRTLQYFEQLGQSPEKLNYFHHIWNSLESFKMNLIHDPRALSSRISRKFMAASSPFPHIVIHTPN